MKSTKVLLGIVVIAAILVAAIPGCSDKTFTSMTAMISPDAQPTAYIPLEEGWRVTYVVLEPESGHFDIEVTDPVTVAGHPGFTIRKTDRATGQIVTFYRYIKDNAIFESQSLSQPGVRILESPFVVGNNWNRYDTVTTSVVIDNGIDDDGPGDTGKEDDEGSLKTIPDDVYSTMSIVAFENVQALNGIEYGNCLKVAWQTDESIVNYYWYAPGIGLVKYEQNVNLLSASSDRTLGVMSDYQLVEY